MQGGPSGRREAGAGAGAADGGWRTAAEGSDLDERPRRLFAGGNKNKWRGLTALLDPVLLPYPSRCTWLGLSGVISTHAPERE